MNVLTRIKEELKRGKVNSYEEAEDVRRRLFLSPGAIACNMNGPMDLRKIQVRKRERLMICGVEFVTEKALLDAVLKIDGVGAAAEVLRSQYTVRESVPYGADAMSAAGAV